MPERTLTRGIRRIRPFAVFELESANGIIAALYEIAFGALSVMGVAHRPALMDRLDEAQRRDLFARSRRRSEPSGVTIFSQGEPVEEVLLLLNGRVKSFFLFPDGSSITHVYWVDEMIMGLPGYTRWGQVWQWSAETVMPSEFLSIPIGYFNELLSRHSEAARWMIEILEFKLELHRRIVRLLATPSGILRLRLILLNLCDLYGQETDDGILINQRFTHEELSELIRASRPWLTQALGELKRSGIIRIDDHKISVLRPDILRSDLTILDQTAC